VSVQKRASFSSTHRAADQDFLRLFHWQRDDVDFGLPGEILSSVKIAMLAGLPYTALRDGILTHPTFVEGLIPLFSSAPSTHNVAETKPASPARQQTTAA
jgi:hypothetical protein